MLAVQALLIACEFVVVVCGLRMLMRLDFATVTNARRVSFAKGIGESFDLEGLPEDRKEAVREGDALFLFVAKGCPCGVALVAFTSLARTHPETAFFVWAIDPWPELLAMQSSRLRVVDSPAFQEQFDTVMYPYFVKTRKGVLVEYGIANLPEQVEAILAAGGPA